jgi:hypothetical protein
MRGARPDRGQFLAQSSLSGSQDGMSYSVVRDLPYIFLCGQVLDHPAMERSRTTVAPEFLNPLSYDLRNPVLNLSS